jgi:hypothetical protein
MAQMSNTRFSACIHRHVSIKSGATFLIDSPVREVSANCGLPRHTSLVPGLGQDIEPISSGKWSVYRVARLCGPSGVLKKETELFPLARRGLQLSPPTSDGFVLGAEEVSAEIVVHPEWPQTHSRPRSLCNPTRAPWQSF